MKNQEVYLVNSITNFELREGSPNNYWVVSFSDYQNWTNDPENRASSTENHEIVNSWLLTIDVLP